MHNLQFCLCSKRGVRQSSPLGGEAGGGGVLGWAGFQPGGGGGVDRAFWLGTPPKKSSIDRPPQNPTEADPRAPEVIQTRNSAKNENGIFGISASRGFRKIIICHVVGGGKNWPFSMVKKSPCRGCYIKARQAYRGENATYPPSLGLFGAIRVPYPKGLNCWFNPL